MTKKTPEEYKAVAMLLGFRYDEEAHLYLKLSKFEYLDPDTLEVMDMGEVKERYHSGLMKSVDDMIADKILGDLYYDRR